MKGELLRKFSAPRTGWRWVRYLCGDRSPLAADLKVTSRCTLECGHCPWVKRQKPDLDTSRWLAVIGELARRGVIYLVLEGGGNPPCAGTCRP